MDESRGAAVAQVGSTTRPLRGTLAEVREQLMVLTVSDLRARYGRGRWQLLKWLIDPFALVGVYLLMVTFIFYRRPPRPASASPARSSRFS